ncbi:MAG TPA: glycosyltransferase [Flavobacterium sp.]|uniref:glycosyltransferase family 2 protein n=1 Tax=Flavobacterium sp. TaxID=239 RepID=UPI002F3EBC31
MLSILIPIYNYNAYPLVQELHKQCLESEIDFEIVCIDDASSQFKTNNNLISLLSNCSLTELPQNIGRSKIRNLLATKSNYDWLLFLDCDTFPEKINYISKYISQINTSAKDAFFGGIIYSRDKPQQDQLLRWVYGQKREAIALQQRIKQPYKTAFVSNLLIKKTIFERFLFDEKIDEYGYEDYTFVQTLKSNGIDIKHIENPLLHLNLDTSALFLSKTMTALETLLSISKANPSFEIDSKIMKTHKNLRLLKMDFLVSKLFQRLKSRLEENLTSKKPSLFIFDSYKIGYFCYLNSK